MRLEPLVCVTLSSVAAILLSSAPALAHNAAHAALAVLGWDAQGVSIVRLTRGLAYRSDDGYRYVCPEVWGGDIAAPSSTIPDGPAVLAAEQLYLIESSGKFVVHPNHEGVGVALARNHEALFGLFRRAGRVELRRITPGASELLRAFEEPFSQLAASDSALAVLRYSGSELVVQQLSLQGELSERVTWSEANPIASAELRASQDQLYVTLVHSAAPWLTLGRVTAGSYEQLRSANSAFAGPLVRMADTLVARDGALELLDGSSRLSTGDYIECLDAFDDVQYACVGDGLTALEQDGLGAPLFEMISLREPDLVRLSDAQRADCSTRWRDLRGHLVLEGRVPAEPVDPSEEGDDAPSAVDEPRSGSRPGGCSLGRGSAHAAGWCGLVLALLPWLRRRHSASEL